MSALRSRGGPGSPEPVIGRQRFTAPRREMQNGLLRRVAPLHKRFAFVAMPSVSFLRKQEPITTGVRVSERRRLLRAYAMAELVPDIHVIWTGSFQDVAGRDKPGTIV